MQLAESPQSIAFPCLRVCQPLGEFYVGAMPFRDLCSVAFFDVRRVLQDERDVERYLGIQRPLNPRRVDDLRQYVTLVDATFPTSIIIAVDQRCAEYDAERAVMKLSNYLGDDGDDPILFRNIARVIDGQHRIAALLEFGGETFELIVAIFVGMDIADQAQVFSTVNLEQTKVQKSLAYDLFALARSRSPQKTCHNVAVALDQDPNSPFFRRIKRLGVATEGRSGETITQATFVEALIPYISSNPKLDRDALLRGKKIPRAGEDELRRMPLRNLFLDDRDVVIAEIIFNYFEAVRRRWERAWGTLERGYMLNKTNGFRALMRLFRPLYLDIARPGEIVEEAEFLERFQRSALQDEDFTVERFVPGSGGQSELFRTLRDELGLRA